MKLIVFLILLIFSLSQNVEKQLSYQQFEKKFQRNYQGQTRAAHKSAFEKNYKKLLKAKQKNPQLSVNNFTDWTDQQLAAFLNYRPKEQIRTKQENKQNKNVLKSSTLPSSFDYRLIDMVAAVRNQGYCGNCWAMATISLYQSYLQLQTNNYYYLSVQYLAECLIPDASLRCSGYIVDPALNLINQTGAPLHDQYYFYATQQTNYTAEGMCVNTDNYVKLISPATQIVFSSDISQYQIQSHIINYGPVLVGVNADNQNFLNLWYGAEYINDCPTVSNILQINHVLLIVGYTTTHWIVQNSWGPFWGKDGFALVNRSRQSDCGISKYAYLFKTQMSLSSYPKAMVKIVINMTDSGRNPWGWILAIRQNNVTVSNFTLSSGSMGSIPLMIDARATAQVVVARSSSYRSSQIGFAIFFGPQNTKVFQWVTGRSFTSSLLGSFCVFYCPTTSGSLGSSNVDQSAQFSNEIQGSPIIISNNQKKLKIALIVICITTVVIIILIVVLGRRYYQGKIRNIRLNSDSDVCKSACNNSNLQAISGIKQITPQQKNIIIG